jgi:hypothetical protein
LFLVVQCSRKHRISELVFDGHVDQCTKNLDGLPALAPSNSELDRIGKG